jgi:hypothetical protein
VALHVTPKPGKPADQGTMNIEPVTAKLRQTFGVLAPHEADSRNHLPDPGVDGAPAVFGLTTAASKV